MPPDFIPMRDVNSTISAGSFSSDGLEIETPWHYHDLHQILYAFEDSVEVECQFARYKVPHQFAVWIPAGAVHRTAIQNVRSGSIFLRKEMIESATDDLRVIPASNLMREMIMYAMRWPITGEDNEISTAFFQCFARLCSEWIAQEVKLVLPVSNDSRINAVVDFTQTHLSSVSLKDVCKAVGMSERTLRRRFQREMGISWEDFRLRSRMYSAIDALDNTDKPIGLIAEKLGYTSQASFARVFKSVMGMGPTQYRKAQR